MRCIFDTGSEIGSSARQLLEAEVQLIEALVTDAPVGPPTPLLPIEKAGRMQDL